MIRLYIGKLRIDIRPVRQISPKEKERLKRFLFIKYRKVKISVYCKLCRHSRKRFFYCAAGMNQRDKKRHCYAFFMRK